MEFNTEEYIEQLKEEFEGKSHHQRQLEILGVNFQKGELALEPPETLSRCPVCKRKHCVRACVGCPERRK